MASGRVKTVPRPPLHGHLASVVESSAALLCQIKEVVIGSPCEESGMKW